MDLPLPSVSKLRWITDYLSGATGPQPDTALTHGTQAGKQSLPPSAVATIVALYKSGASQDSTADAAKRLNLAPPALAWAHLLVSLQDSFRTIA